MANPAAVTTIEPSTKGHHMRYILAILPILAACGGGGESVVEPLAVQKPCVVQLLGDSTMATAPVSQSLQEALDARLGVGRAYVVLSARPGTTSADLVKGAAGYDPFPNSLTGDVIVANYGINDARKITIAEFRSNLRAMADRGVIIQTPIPTVAVDTSAYAEAAREVGAKIDVHAWAAKQATWAASMPDGIHPDAQMLHKMAQEAMAPVIAKAVEACVRFTF